MGISAWRFSKSFRAWLCLALTVSATSFGNTLDNREIQHLGIRVSVGTEDGTKKLSFAIDGDVFSSCAAVDYANFVIWDEQGHLIFREKIEIIGNVNRTFRVEPQDRVKYHYHLYIDAARSEYLDEGDSLCNRLRQNMSVVDFNRALEG